MINFDQRVFIIEYSLFLQLMKEYLFLYSLFLQTIAMQDQFQPLFLTNALFNNTV